MKIFSPNQSDPCPDSQIRIMPNIVSTLFFIGTLAFFIGYSKETRSAMEAFRLLFELDVSADVLIALSLMLVSALPMILSDLYFLRVKKQGNAPVSKATIDWKQLLFKLLGIWFSLTFLGFIYWLLPEYGDWYQRFWQLLWLVLPFLFIISPFYVFYVECSFGRNGSSEKDSYYYFAAAILGVFWRKLWSECKAEYLYEHLRQWIIKVFFLPLMTIFLFNNISAFLDYNFSTLGDSFKSIFDFLYLSFYTVDVLFAAIGYFFTFKLLNTDIRSAEPSLLGWLVCIACYPPFWNGLLGKVYFDYNNDFYWGQWLTDNILVYTLWGSGILLLILVYVLATVSLGYRFSNLTYRGLTTTGVYRLTKHPAYIAKNLSWWMISIPFISQGDYSDVIRSCLLLGGVNYIYYLRAKTEERHLSHYPEYIEYANWINRHGLFRGLALIFPALSYNETTILEKSTAPWWHFKTQK